MSIHTHATTPREVWLIAAGSARGTRQTLMRNARSETRPMLRSVLVRSARDFNRDMLAYLRNARTFA